MPYWDDRFIYLERLKNFLNKIRFFLILMLTKVVKVLYKV